MAYKIISLGQSPELAPQQPQKESSSFNPLTTLGGVAARGVEAVLGMPADILQGVGNLVGAGIEKLTGIQVPPITEIPLPDISRGRQLFETGLSKRPGQESLPPRSGIPLPTSEALREATRFITGDLFEPKNEIEQQLQEFVSTLTPFLVGGVSPTHAVATAGLGQLAKFGAEQIGVPKEYQEPIKAGTMLTTSLIGIPRMESFAKNLYEQARAQLPENTTVSAQAFLPNIKKIEKAIVGNPFPGKNVVLENLAALEEAINPVTKTVPAMQLWDLKKTVNEWLRDPSLRKSSTAKQNLGNISKIISDVLVQETKKTAPGFSQNLKYADDIWRSLRAQQDTSSIIGSAISKIKKGLTPTTVGILGYMFPKKTLVGAVGIGIGKGLGTIMQGIKESFSNPGVRHYYTKMIESALKNNQPTLIQALKGFDKEVSKSQPSEKASSGSYKILELGS